MAAAAPPRVASWEWWGLAVIMIGALGLRLYAIDRIPAVVFHDECDNLVTVYQILHQRGPGLFGFDWKPQPAASMYLLSGFMTLGGSIGALRLPAALYSVAALLPFFLLARRALCPVAALGATLLLATDMWYLHFSRTGWENVQTCLFLAAAGVCMQAALRTGRMRSFAFTGLWSALGLYGYFSGRTVLPAVMAVGLVALIRPTISRRRIAAGLGVTVTVAGALFAPQALRIAQDPDTFLGRTRDVYVLGGANAHAPPGRKVALVGKMFGGKGLELLYRRVLKRGEPVERYVRMDGGPFPRAVALLLAGGMLLSFVRLRDTWQWWLLFLVPFGATQALTLGSLNGARGVIFVPILYLFVGLALDAVWRVGRRRARLLALPFLFAVVALSAWSVRQYFTWVQSRELLESLEPAVQLDEFPRWQADVIEWTAAHDEFVDLQRWRAEVLPRHCPDVGAVPVCAP